MIKIIISPYSKKLRNGGVNPKNYPIEYWKDTVLALKAKGYYIIQIGVSDEIPIDNIDEIKLNLSLKELEILVKECTTFICVDNFFNHFCKSIDKRGVVIWGKSDPKIYGYPENINLLKDVKYLRPDQFNIWEECSYDKDCFVEPKVVVEAVEKVIVA